jgi:hypothetical protein
MSIEITIDVDDTSLQATLKAFGRDAPGILDKILANTSAAYRLYVRRNFLSGQMLAKLTGQLQKSMRYKKARGKKHEYIISAQPKLANIYEHAGGVNIVPKAKKILFWRDGAGEPHFARSVHLASRPFMTRSSSAFNFAGAFDTAVDRVIDKELKKRGLEEQ